MLWSEQLAEKVSGPQIINDSKTPSGRVHVGAMRGVLIHDAIYRTLQERGIRARYLFGVDDYDPLDELPAGKADFFRQYLGAPLCMVPPPDGSTASDMAEHYIAEFFEIFKELGVEVETYRMRDVYREGRFNEAIDTILRKAEIVRFVYKKVSNSDRPPTWHPFQTICEKCGRIGTTEVTAYDGREVTYTCRPDMVKWAQGCGYAGKVSPFDGRGKLPWKLEWVAKWVEFPVTIEGAGKDHSTRGGSRDVSEACMREIFSQKPPLNVPYEFFLVGGAKMSSSRGVGASARDIASLLPPEVLRFLMIRTKPNSIVNFSPGEEAIVKLFNEFDRYHDKVFHNPAVTADEKRVYALSELRDDGHYYAAHFQFVVTLVQMPHLDVAEQIARHKGAPLTETDLRRLHERIASAKYWLENYATEEDRVRLQETLPASAADLSVVQRAFLRNVATAFETVEWENDALQSMLFEVARRTPIKQPTAFEAIYRVILDKSLGPKAGNLLAVLERDFVVRRFREVALDEAAFWRAASVPVVELQAWVKEGERQNVEGRYSGGVGALEVTMAKPDGKVHLHRAIFEGTEEAFQQWRSQIESEF